MSQQLSLPALTAMLEFGEGEAYADLNLAAPAELGIRTERIGSAICLLADQFDMMLFNRVLGLGVQSPATEALVDEIVALYARAGVRNFAIQLSPVVQPVAFPVWLQAHQLRARDRWAKVYRPADTPLTIPTDLRIECIGPERAADFAEVACRAFGMPDVLKPWLSASVGRSTWCHYVAYDGDVPVATGALFVRGNVGWLGIGSALPSHRRRGAQGALMAQRIRDGARLGCDWLITERSEDVPESPNPSYHNMIRIGFKPAYQRPNYVH